MEKKRMKKSGDRKAYNSLNAVIQLTVDKDFKVAQVDMAAPATRARSRPLNPK
jgi:hypothetical protein